MSAPRPSAVVVARNEEAQLGECLAALSFRDEIVAVLDRRTDASAAIARSAGARTIEGGWGFAIALFAGLYPLLACLRARLEEDPPGGDAP